MTLRTRFDPTRYPAAYLRARVSEAAVQRNVLSYLEASGILAWPVDAGARALRGGSRIAHGSVAPAGLPDVLGATKWGRVVAVECKAPAWIDDGARGPKVIRAAGEPTPQQVGWLEALASRGAYVCVAWGMEDVAEMLCVCAGTRKVTEPVVDEHGRYAGVRLVPCGCAK